MITIVTPTAEAEEYGMIIPLSAVLTEDGLHIHAYPEAEDAARRLDSLAPHTIDAEVRAMLHEMLAPIVQKMGYAPDLGYTDQVGQIFRAERIEQIDRGLIRPDTVRYVREAGHEFLTETELDEESDACTIFATLRGNRVLSFANLNTDDGEVAEIGVETATGAEGQGLAASNVAALTLHLLAGGRDRVVYVALSDNPASSRVAEKVGFVKAGEEYNYVCFLMEEEEKEDGV